MNTTTSAGSGRHVANGMLALMALLIYAAVLAGLNQTLGLGDGTAFWLLFLVGMTLCSLGPLGKGEQVGWWNPGHLLGYLLGSVALLLGAALLFDFALPGIHTPRTAVLVLGLLMAVKMGIARLYPRATEAERRKRG